MKRVTFLLEETDLDQVEDYLMKNKWRDQEMEVPHLKKI